jgi:hypothetical protein
MMIGDTGRRLMVGDEGSQTDAEPPRVSLDTINLGAYNQLMKLIRHNQ